MHSLISYGRVQSLRSLGDTRSTSMPWQTCNDLQSNAVIVKQILQDCYEHKFLIICATQILKSRDSRPQKLAPTRL